jgi:hypothetical protein
MTETSSPPAGPPSVASPAFSVPSALVALLAALSLLVMASVAGKSITISAPLLPRFISGILLYEFAPQLLIIALVLSGYPRGADVLAIFIGCATAVLNGIVGLLTFDGPLAGVVFMQVMMALFAIIDLTQRRATVTANVDARWRLLALVVPIAIGWLGYNMIHAPFAKETARRASLTRSQRADEMGFVIEPSPLRPDSIRLASSGWLVYSVAGNVVGLARCIEQFRGDSGGPYPRSLRELHDWSMRDTLSSNGCARRLTRSTRDTTNFFLGPDDGHLVRYTPPSGPIDPLRPAPFIIETEAIWDSVRMPNAKGQPGVRNYLLDSAGKLHVTDKHRRVTRRDPVLQPCDPPTEYRAVAECALVYRARERWGAVRMPFARLDVAYKAQAGEQFRSTLEFNPTTALDSVARVTLDWGDSNPPVLEEVPIASERSYGAHDWNRVVQHAYTTPGHRVVTLTITTRNGDVYHAEDTIDVVQ